MCFALAKPHAAERRVREHAVRHQAITRATVPAAEIVTDDAEVIDRHMRKLRAAGTFAERPDPGRRRLQSLVDADVAAAVQLDSHFFEADAGRVWDPPRCDQQVAALDFLLAGGSAHRHADLFTGSA